MRAGLISSVLHRLQLLEAVLEKSDSTNNEFLVVQERMAGVVKIRHMNVFLVGQNTSLHLCLTWTMQPYLQLLYFAVKVQGSDLVPGFFTYFYIFEPSQISCTFYLCNCR